MDDEIVSALHEQFLKDRTSLALWTKSCIAEIMQSVADDLRQGRCFAYLTRWRQPEELYHRALYIMFVASPDEIPHVISGETPNNFSDVWRKVNEVVFEGKGNLLTLLGAATGKESKLMNALNSHAHASYITMLTCIGMRRSTFDLSPLIKDHMSHWQRFCLYLDQIEELFRADNKRDAVLTAIRNMHKSGISREEVSVLRI